MRRNRVLICLLIFVIVFSCGPGRVTKEKPKVAFSFDDGSTKDVLSYTDEEWNAMIRRQLKARGLQAVWYVKGKGLDNEEGKELLKNWDEEGHIIANHTYSHYNYNNPSIDFTRFSNDIKKCDALINGFGNYSQLFRFPYLKSGATRESRDSMRTFLEERGFRQGWITIDASDWYINSRMIRQMKKDPGMDISGFREYYLDHILDRAKYYNDLSVEINGRQICHTLLLHFNLTSALFLDDLIEKFEREGWEIINYTEAVKDPVYNNLPDVMPAEQSLIWLMAKETGKYEVRLRYPGEDGEYEREKMDKSGL